MQQAKINKTINQEKIMSLQNLIQAANVCLNLISTQPKNTPSCNCVSFFPKHTLMDYIHPTFPSSPFPLHYGPKKTVLDKEEERQQIREETQNYRNMQDLIVLENKAIYALLVVSAGFAASSLFNPRKKTLQAKE